MLYDEITAAIIGKDDKGLPKCAISVDKYIFDVITREPSSSVSRHLTNVSVNLTKIPSTDRFYIQADFTFPTSINFELKLFWELLQEYGTEVGALTEKSSEVPQIFFTLVPISYEGKYYVLSSAPLFWGLIADKVDKTPDTVRVLFDAENVSIFETNSIDYEKIVQIVDEEITAEEKAEQERADRKEAKIIANQKELLGIADDEDETEDTVTGNVTEKGDNSTKEEKRYKIIE